MQWRGRAAHAGLDPGNRKRRATSAETVAADDKQTRAAVAGFRLCWPAVGAPAQRRLQATPAQHITGDGARMGFARRLQEAGWRGLLTERLLL